MPFVMMFTVCGFSAWAKIPEIVGTPPDPAKVEQLMVRAEMVIQDFLKHYEKAD